MLVLALLCLAAGTRADADRLFIEGKYDEAARAYVQLLESQGNDPKVWQGLGQSLMGLRRYRESVPALREWVRLDTGSRPAQRTLAEAYLRAGNNAEAERILNALVLTDKTDAASFHLQAESAYRTGYFDRCLVALDQLGKLNAETGQDRIWRCVSLIKVGRAEEGVALTRQLLDGPQPPNDVDLSLTLAEYLAENDKEAEAMAVVNDAIRFAPAHPIPPYWKARLLQREGKQAEAVAEAERSVELNPNLPYARSLLVQAYRQLGRTADAEKQAAWLKEYESRDSRPQSQPAATAKPKAK